MAEEEKSFMRAVVAGLSDLDNNRMIDLNSAKKQFIIRDRHHTKSSLMGSSPLLEN